MLIRRGVLDRIVAGEISLQFRRQKRPSVRTGGRLRTVVGELAIHDVRAVEEKAITAADVRCAGHESRRDLLAELPKRPGTRLHRVELSYVGADQRSDLRRRSRISAADRSELESRLERYDRSSRRGPWTHEALSLIADHPGRRAAELAEMAGHDRTWWKANIRKLKELGLTESLKVGYRLSPRGSSFRATLEE